MDKPAPRFLIVLVFMLGCLGPRLQAELPRFPEGRIALGHRIVAVSQQATCYFVELSTPTAPRLMGQIRFSSQVTALAFAPPLLFVGLADGQVARVNLANSERPLTSGTLMLHGRVRALHLAGDTLVAAGDELVIFDDVTSQPRPRMPAALTRQGLVGIGTYQALVLATTAQGGRQQLVTWREGAPPQASAAELNFNWQRIAFEGERGATAGGEGLTLYDFTMPATPRPLANNPGTGNYEVLHLTPRTLYAATAKALELYGVEEPGALPLLERHALSNAAVAVDAEPGRLVLLDQLGLLHIFHANGAGRLTPEAMLPIGMALRPIGNVEAQRERVREQLRGLRGRNSVTSQTAPTTPTLPRGGAQ